MARALGPARGARWHTAGSGVTVEAVGTEADAPSLPAPGEAAAEAALASFLDGPVGRTMSPIGILSVRFLRASSEAVSSAFKIMQIVSKSSGLATAVSGVFSFLRTS